MSNRANAYSAALLHPGGRVDLQALVPRRQLVEDFGLKPRDIVALFSKNARRGFGFSVRRGGALLSMGRDGPAVVVAKRAAWILPRGSNIETVGMKIQNKYEEVVSLALPQVSGNPSNVSEEAASREPFALAVTEALLAIFLDRLTTQLKPAIDEANKLLRDYARTRQGDVTTLQLEKLRRTKQRLDYMQSQAKSFQQELIEALGDEDDLSQLASSVGPTTEEWELCFEYYSQSAEELDLEATGHIESLEDLERSISLRLSSRRLELEKSQLSLELLGLGLNAGALLTGAFGMNLVSGLETQRPRFFYQACAGICLVCAAVSGGLKLFVSRRLRRQGLLVWKREEAMELFRSSSALRPRRKGTW